MSNVRDGTRLAVGYVHIADVSTAGNIASFGTAIPEGARVAIIQGHTADVRWRDDGTSPAKAITGGMLLAADDSFLYTGELSKLEFVEAANAVTAGVNISFYG